eukprot:2739052-Rhodomonas_salina.3
MRTGEHLCECERLVHAFMELTTPTTTVCFTNEGGLAPVAACVQIAVPSILPTPPRVGSGEPALGQQPEPAIQV